MENSNSEFKYEVGFSFLEEDHAIALQLGDLIGDQYSNFIYSDEQKRLAFDEGDVAFREVFYTECRTVVILLRDGWGDTSFTRIEEQAIRDRAHERGWDFVKVIVLNSPKIPSWLSRRYIYYDFYNYGAETAAQIIKTHIQLQGGKTSEQSLESANVAHQRNTKFLKERKAILATDGPGLKLADESVLKLFNQISIFIEKQIKEGQEVTFHENDNRVYAVCYEHVCLYIQWIPKSMNSLDDSELQVQIWNGLPPRMANYFFNEKPHVLESDVYNFDIGYDLSSRWKEYDSSVLLSENLLAEKVLKKFMKKEQEEI